MFSNMPLPMQLTAGMYFICATVGGIGNAVVIAMIIRVFWHNGRKTPHVYGYVLFLSIVDLVFISINSPFLMLYMIYRDWLFGTALCKSVYAVEGLNKTLSVHLLVIFSFDRYLAICHATTSDRLRSAKAAFRLLIIATLGGLVCNLPIYMYAKTVSFEREEIVLKSSDSGAMVPLHGGMHNLSSYNMSELTTRKTTMRICMLAFPRWKRPTGAGDCESTGPWDHFGGPYTLFLFVVYFLIPALLIMAFYARTLIRVRRQYSGRQPRSRTRSAKYRVTRSVALVVAFYFACWTPYWILQILIQFSVYHRCVSVGTQMGRMIASAIHSLPYLNSAVNPILYAFLNKSLTQAYAAARAKQSRTSEKMQNPDSSTWDLREFGTQIFEEMCSRVQSMGSSFRLRGSTEEPSVDSQLPMISMTQLTDSYEQQKYTGQAIKTTTNSLSSPLLIPGVYYKKSQQMRLHPSHSDYVIKRINGHSFPKQHQHRVEATFLVRNNQNYDG
uniref:G-protein coupled receptors family 1 profile domain-containing protein n=1 Tax=Plectus sambesii TaxID=2011161 RepID=A0A914WNV5_9BILA